MSDESVFDLCVRALQAAGCRVEVEPTTVRVLLPPDPNDRYAAPDGEERVFDRATFTLICASVYLRHNERPDVPLALGSHVFVE